MSTVTKPIMLDETGKEIVNAIRGLKGGEIYGVYRDITQSGSAWTRELNSVGLTANATKDGGAVVNDFDGVYPYSEIISVNYSNGGVVARYGDTNFKFDGTNGDVLTYIPDFWYRRFRDGNIEHIRISRNQFDGAKHSEAFYVGRYTTSASTKSISGVASTVSQDIATFRTQAKAKGTGFGLLDYHVFLLQMLYLVEYADYNSQAILGQGVCSVSAQVNTGGCDSLGMKSGCLADDGAHSMIYRGVENIFGNIWQFVDGLGIKDYQAYICYENPKMQGCIWLLKKIKENLVK